MFPDCDHTFEAFAACLLQKTLFLAVVRNVTAVILYLSKRVDLKLLDLAHRFLIKMFKRRKINFTLDLTLGKNGTVLSHLMLLDRGRCQHRAGMR